jgi:cAMP-dependent protein kinase regulator
MSDKLRKLKDEAAKLLQKGKLDKALEAYQEILKEDKADVTAQLKCGDILRKLEKPAEAIACYTQVAETYAADGLLLKAIAACKLILEIDANHSTTQKMLADLYAKKTGRAAAAAPPPPPLPKPKTDDAQMVSDDDIIIDEVEEVPAPQALPTIPLFSDLPKNAFIQLMEQMKMRSVLPDEVIIKEGDVDDSMFIISSGRVKVTKTTDSGAEVVLASLSDGTFFGEMALLAESPRTASVIAQEETVLFEVSRQVLAEVVKNFPSVHGILMRFYRQRLLSNLMATSPIFKPLSVEQRKSLIEQFKSRELPANEKVMEEGTPGDGLYLLLTGQAEVSKRVDGKRTVLAHLKSGEIFGERSLLTNQPTSASIKTLKKSIVLKLPKKIFTEIAQAHPQLMQHIAALSNERDKTTQAILAGQLKFGEEGLVVV